MMRDDLFMRVSEDDICGAAPDSWPKVTVSFWLIDCRHSGTDCKISEEVSGEEESCGPPCTTIEI